MGTHSSEETVRVALLSVVIFHCSNHLVQILETLLPPFMENPGTRALEPGRSCLYFYKRMGEFLSKWGDLARGQ
jgi:hypothetical protein